MSRSARATTQNYLLGNWAYCLSVLLQNQLSLPEGLRLTQEAIPNQSLARATGGLIQKLQEGETFAKALASQHEFLPLVAHEINPRSLVPSLLHVSDFLIHGAEASQQIFEREESWLTTIFIGLIIGAICFWGIFVLSMFLPQIRIGGPLQG